MNLVLGMKGYQVAGKDGKILLGVNIDHVATLRQARKTDYPDVVKAARLAEQAGADGITIHLREDRRHIQDADVYTLKTTIDTRLNLEMAVTEEMVGIASDVLPEYCCFVPERREELTTEGGLDAIAIRESVEAAVLTLQKRGIRCSLFINPELPQIDCAYDIGTRIVELHTGAYADAETDSVRQSELTRLRDAAKYAAKKGMQVNAGHGLNYENVQEIAAIKEVRELNIGHSIICRSVFTGLKDAVRTMKKEMEKARRN